MISRLCSSTANNKEVLEHLNVMNTSTWPDSSELNIRYGKEQVKKLKKRFELDEKKVLPGMRAMVDGEKIRLTLHLCS